MRRMFCIWGPLASLRHLAFLATGYDPMHPDDHVLFITTDVLMRKFRVTKSCTDEM